MASTTRKYITDLNKENKKLIYSQHEFDAMTKQMGGMLYIVRIFAHTFINTYK